MNSGFTSCRRLRPFQGKNIHSNFFIYTLIQSGNVTLYDMTGIQAPTRLTLSP